MEKLEDLDCEDLTNYCECSDYGNIKMGTGPWSMCEGVGCKKAYERWLEKQEKEGEQNDKE